MGPFRPRSARGGKEKKGTTSNKNKGGKMSTMRLKILTMGESGVGKTSIVKRYRYNTSQTEQKERKRVVVVAKEDQFSQGYSPTIGVDFFSDTDVHVKTRNVNGKPTRVACTFFDLSGDISFLKVRTEFYPDYHGAMLIFDITSRQSFERLEFWLKEAAKFGGAIDSSKGCIVCGNKADLQSQREVPEREARTWANVRGFEYFEVSAKTGKNMKTAMNGLFQTTRADVTPPSKPAPTRRSSRSSSSSSSSSTPRGRKPSFSSSSSSSASSASSARRSVDPDSMSVKELKRELAAMNVDSQDCLEKKDLVRRLREVLRERKERQQKQEAEDQKERQQDEKKDGILREVKAWAGGKDVRAMLNHIHGYQPNHPSFLARQTGFSAISKAYKKALLKIHPDKVGKSNPDAHLRATEMFKALHSAYDLFKKQNEKRSSFKMSNK